MPLPISYKGLRLASAYKMDLLVENSVIVEIKAIEEIAPIHSAQVLTYLRACQKRLGQLINFNVPVLRRGLKRIVNGFPPCLSASVSNGGPS